MPRPQGSTRLGRANVYRDRDGELVVDTDSLRRFGDDVEGDDFEGDDLEGDDLEGDDDVGDDDVGDDDVGDEEMGDDDVGDDEVGRRRRRRRKKLPKGAIRRLQKAGYTVKKKKRGPTGKWVKTIIGGATVFGAAGTATMTLTPQHQFKCEDLSFTGSTAGIATITRITFGDNTVFDNSDGISADLFAANGFIRDLMKGQSIGHGYSIKVAITASGAGTVRAAFTGWKPGLACN